MSDFFKKFLKVFAIFLLVVFVILSAMYTSYAPGIDNLKELTVVAEKFNGEVDTDSLITNTIRMQDRNTCIEKFNNSGKNIFSGSSADYNKMLNYRDSENVTIELTMREYSFLSNTLKNSSNFLTYADVNILLSKTLFVGMNKTKYYKSILVKVDITEILSSMQISDLIQNNLYLTISKDSLNNYSFKINNLEQNDSIVVQEIFEDFFAVSSSFSQYKFDTMSRKIFDEYEKLCQNFETFVNVTIKL